MTRSHGLEAPSPNLPDTSDSEAEALTVGAIVYDEVNVAPLEDIESAAKAHLRIEIDLGSIEDNGQGDKFIFGNPGGHRLFSKLDQMTRNIEILFSRDARVTEQIENCQQEIVSLKGQVGLLVQSSEGYLKIREKFLAVFERDIKGVDTRNSTAIREGNIRAYEGDAVADAALFDQYNRSDTPLYLELYGLEFRKVLELRNTMRDDGGVIRVINA